MSLKFGFESLGFVVFGLFGRFSIRSSVFTFACFIFLLNLNDLDFYYSDYYSLQTFSY
jgi:hypothetical protein